MIKAYRIKDIFFEKYEFKRTKKNIGNSLEVKQEPTFKIEKENVTVRLSINIQDELKAFELSANLVGEFELKIEGEQVIDKQEETLIFQTLLAVMYPNMRSQITLLTSMPGFNSIMLPIVYTDAIIANK